LELAAVSMWPDVVVLVLLIFRDSGSGAGV
jgi:hypothetical protein